MEGDAKLLRDGLGFDGVVVLLPAGGTAMMSSFTYMRCYDGSEQWIKAVA